jgi:hypothetical protein
VAARYPREKTDLAHFDKYDPAVPRVVSIYAFFQLVAVVLLLNFMQGSEVAYWSGVALWVLLVATTVITALWLEGRDAGDLMKWEISRLAGFGALLAVAWQGQLGTFDLVTGVMYGALNLLLLVLVRAAHPTLDRALPHA